MSLVQSSRMNLTRNRVDQTSIVLAGDMGNINQSVRKRQGRRSVREIGKMDVWVRVGEILTFRYTMEMIWNELKKMCFLLFYISIPQLLYTRATCVYLPVPNNNLTDWPHAKIATLYKTYWICVIKQRKVVRIYHFLKLAA